MKILLINRRSHTAGFMLYGVVDFVMGYKPAVIPFETYIEKNKSMITKYVDIKTFQKRVHAKCLGCFHALINNEFERIDTLCEQVSWGENEELFLRIRPTSAPLVVEFVVLVPKGMRDNKSETNCSGLKVLFLAYDLIAAEAS